MVMMIVCVFAESQLYQERAYYEQQQHHQQQQQFMQESNYYAQVGQWNI